MTCIMHECGSMYTVMIYLGYMDKVGSQAANSKTSCEGDASGDVSLKYLDKVTELVTFAIDPVRHYCI